MTATRAAIPFTRSVWQFEQSPPDALRLEGELDGSSITVELKARDPNDFTLLSRGFHWINEEPFNP